MGILRNIRQYVQEKAYSWMYKTNTELSDENPVIFDFKYTKHHLRDLLFIARKEGIREAVKFDLETTLMMMAKRLEIN